MPEVFTQALEVGSAYVHPDSCVVANDSADFISNCVGSLLAVVDAILLVVDAQPNLEPRTTVESWRKDRRENPIVGVDDGE